MRNKIIYSNFNIDTGISEVTIQNKYGTFTGKAKLNPTDTPSSYQGCRIAEKRAIISCLKYRKRQAVKKLNICQKFYDVVTASKDLLVIAMRQYLDNLQYTCNSLEKQIIAEEAAIQQDIQDRDKIIKRFRKIKEK